MKVALTVCLLALVYTIPSEGQLLPRSLGGNLVLANCPTKPSPGTYPDIPASFDLRQTYPQCMIPMLDQSSCGSCWAFAAAAVLTERFCIKSNNTIKRLLSPQDLVNCDKTCQFPLLRQNCNQGCNGGYLDNTWTYFNQNGGVGWSCVPYKSVDEPCNTTKCDPALATKYYSSACYKLASIRDIQTDIMLNGPVEVGFTVYNDFFSLTNAIYVKNSDTAAGGHAVRLIGWGTENGVDFWIGANQWGTGWGDRGYFRIRRGTNEAGIEATAIAGTPDINAVTKVEYEQYETALGIAVPTPGGGSGVPSPTGSTPGSSSSGSSNPSSSPQLSVPGSQFARSSSAALCVAVLGYVGFALLLTAFNF